jgi:hypothetical protein
MTDFYLKFGNDNDSSRLLYVFSRESRRETSLLMNSGMYPNVKEKRRAGRESRRRGRRETSPGFVGTSPGLVFSSPGLVVTRGDPGATHVLTVYGKNETSFNVLKGA